VLRKHDEFASRRHGRDLRPSALREAGLEAVQRSRSPGRVPCRLNEQPSDFAGALFADLAVPGGL